LPEPPPYEAAAPADGLQALAQIPELAIQRLSGMVAAILLPARNLTICRTRPGHSLAAESALLTQMHRHLMTRAQLHGCTLVANKLFLDGSHASVPYKAISTPIRDEWERVVGVLAVFRIEQHADFELRDAEALELLAWKAAEIIRASFDAVTGMLTSAAFVAEATARLIAPADAARTHGLLYIDIDQLNVVNENHGMHVGDEVIQSVAALVSRRGREGALACRIGGDRFAMLVPGCGIEPAARIAEGLRSCAIKLSCARGDKPLLVSLSIGVSRIGERDRRLDQAIAAAEHACRTAKERGRNRVEIFYGNAQDLVQSRMSPGYEVEVAAALALGSFELLAQPILPLSAAPADPRFEILLRVRASDGSRLCLDKLKAVGCEALARSIDRWVIEQCIERLSGCRELLRLHPARFSVNLSAASLTDGEFWRMLEERVRKARIEPGTLCFEFPEEAAAGNSAMIAPFMCRLREQGISFALDHVGRGSGAISSLNSLPVSCIKIDGSVSRDLVDNAKSRAMMAAITQFAKSAGLETVVGYVETDAIRALAAKLGVDYGQGFFIGKPLILDEAIRDLPLYSCFATPARLFDAPAVQAAASGN
jgi:diguanylate cyclase (GGDEF)-like protein